MAMAFGAVTILMDTIYQHFLQPEPRFPLRNKTKVRFLYKNLSSLQNSLEQDFKVGEYCDEAAIKALEAQMRDVSVELRFEIEEQLRLFYLGKSMKLRLHSAKNLLPILNGAIKGRGIETIDFVSILDILAKHFALPVSRMPPHIKKRVKSFCTQHQRFLYEQESDYEQEVGDDEQENKNEQEVSDGEETDDEKESEYEQANKDEWETEEEKIDRKQGSEEDEQEMNDEQKRYMFCEEAENIIRQELRAPSSYLNQYMKQRIQARHRIRQIFTLGINLTSYIKNELLKLKNNARHQSKNSENNNTASPPRPEIGEPLQHSSESTINIMVGCDAEFNMIMDKLNQRSSKREIVSILGMGGIGKTTLARRIYEDTSFISRFDCKAWVTISQEYNPKQVFKRLLRSLGPVVCENNEASNYELAEQVYKVLKHRRYLILVDDIWNTDVWDDLMRCFQDDDNGSRILLTTRLKYVAKYAAGSGRNFCHNKWFLGSSESWNLFCKKVLSKRIILSPEFEMIAREIIEKCKGLPLAITVAAGLLSNSNQTINDWERIAKNVPTLSLDHSNQQCENIIDLSYTFLPHHLKLCFLSFGCFPEDFMAFEYNIVDFWVSEGFLKGLRSESLEDVARRNLQDLADRNLVHISEGRSRKSPRAYIMHDVLRELALREAQKENLLCFKDGFGLSLRYRRIQPLNSSCISQPWSIQSRICSYNGITPTSNTSSLIDSLGYRYNITTSRAHFKFLRALEVSGGVYVQNTLLEIVGLLHLRWLAIEYCRLNIHHLPLFMLWNLQKLEVGLHSSCEPLDIWGLSQLKILNIQNAVTLVPPMSVHYNLKIIRSLDYRSCTEELFMRIPNLRILRVTTYHTINLKCKESNWFESLVHLYKLEELEVHDTFIEYRTIHSMRMLSLKNFLPNLKKLRLSCTFLEWKDMDVVSMLPKLEDLELSSDAVASGKWEPKDGGFRVLKFLEIYECGLACWEATSDHFPILEELDLCRVDLKEIPSGFVDITTLKSIKLGFCSQSLISSAERIQKELQDYGNDTFVVNIIRW